MSRIGKKLISVPDKVKVAISGSEVKVEGPKGKLSLTLPEAIEARLAKLNQQINSVSFYQQEPGQVKKTLDEAQDLARELEIAYERWNELDALAESLSR